MNPSKPSPPFQTRYLPPLLVYVAAGLQGLTALAETFFIKERLGLSAEFLAALAFWASLPYVAKMPLGHIVDVLWRHKTKLLIVGAALVAASMLMLLGLLTQPERMAQSMSLSQWFVLTSILAPIGFVLQDVVADAMTVEAVATHQPSGNVYSDSELKAMHTQLQLLGRLAIIGGSLLVAVLNVVVFAGSLQLDANAKLVLYERLFTFALFIPLISLTGVGLARHLRLRDMKTAFSKGLAPSAAAQAENTKPNAWILGGSALYVALTLALGASGWRWRQEAVFVVSLTIVLGLLWRMVRTLSPEAKQTLFGTALLVFMFRAAPSNGAGLGAAVTWWGIDVLGFDEAFLSKLSLITASLTIVGLWLLRGWMARQTLWRVVWVLMLLDCLLALHNLGMSLGLHHWTAAHTGGVIDAQAIAILNTALESPLGQVAMVPMLAWIAHSAPAELKATYFAVMASLTNLAISAGQLLVKYLNQMFTLTRTVKDPATQSIVTPANYADMPAYLATMLLLGLALPLAGMAVVKLLRWRSA